MHDTVWLCGRILSQICESLPPFCLHSVDKLESIGERNEDANEKHGCQLFFSTSAAL